MKKRAEKILTRINELAAISDEQNFVSRIFGTQAFIEGQKKVFQWMEETGLKTRIDSIGNVRGRLTSSSPNAKTFVIGSHVDTVINAGKFDGPLGVIMGLDIIEHLIQTKKEIPFHIELIAFSDEEGVRFHSTFLGSRVVAGSFENSWLDKKDAAGISLQEAIRSMNGEGTINDSDMIPKSEWLGYFEIHIEQGPVLYEEHVPVAIVSAIAGQQRAELTFRGMAGHAGTVPMKRRSDALTCAAEFILATEKFAKENLIVATVGKLDIINAASNVIPGEVICTLDVRSNDEELLQNAYNAIKGIAEKICTERSITLIWKHIQKTEPVHCDKSLTQLLAKSIEESGYKLISLVSGAGHDGVVISEVSPVSMLFVRCFKGISHNPLENVEIQDLEAALKVADLYLNMLTEKK